MIGDNVFRYTTTPLDPNYKYILLSDYVYLSKRYNRTITVYANFKSDGATGAIDVDARAFFVHDQICTSPFWDSYEPVTAWQAARVLSDILKEDGHWVRSYTWLVTTFLFGCERARANGWF